MRDTKCAPDNHAYEMLSSGYFKKTEDKNKLVTMDQSISYATLYCTKCGDRIEIMCNDTRPVDKNKVKHRLNKYLYEAVTQAARTSYLAHGLDASVIRVLLKKFDEELDRANLLQKDVNKEKSK